MIIFRVLFLIFGGILVQKESLTEERNVNRIKFLQERKKRKAKQNSSARLLFEKNGIGSLGESK